MRLLKHLARRLLDGHACEKGVKRAKTARLGWREGPNQWMRCGQRSSYRFMKVILHLRQKYKLKELLLIVSHNRTRMVGSRAETNGQYIAMDDLVAVGRKVLEA